MLFLYIRWSHVELTNKLRLMYRTQIPLFLYLHVSFSLSCDGTLIDLAKIAWAFITTCN